MTFEEWWNLRVHPAYWTKVEWAEKAWDESRKELLGLIDGAMVAVELSEAKYPSQKAWKADWIKKAREALK